MTEAILSLQVLMRMLEATILNRIARQIKACLFQTKSCLARLGIALNTKIIVAVPIIVFFEKLAYTALNAS